ncbi:hypothetical protein [Variovorax sp. KK3]|uniref:hypothetical protein n=1 Tax=Variovorax sp. KK3 TaxID=1855728 RepID=UPI00097CA80E|nr:hypothetical protein [Variovorax sp. KK3]
MSTKAARREYLQAVAEFQRACRDFSRGMSEVLPPPQAQEPGDASFIARTLGPSRPAKRAPQRSREALNIEKKA